MRPATVLRAAFEAAKVTDPSKPIVKRCVRVMVRADQRKPAAKRRGRVGK